MIIKSRIAIDPLVFLRPEPVICVAFDSSFSAAVGVVNTATFVYLLSVDLLYKEIES